MYWLQKLWQQLRRMQLTIELLASRLFCCVIGCNNANCYASIISSWNSVGCINLYWLNSNQCKIIEAKLNHISTFTEVSIGFSLNYNKTIHIGWRRQKKLMKRLMVALKSGEFFSASSCSWNINSICEEAILRLLLNTRFPLNCKTFSWRLQFKPD